MKTTAIAGAVAALLIGTQGLAAQEPRQRPLRDSMHQAAVQEHMRMMDSANARLDSLVQRMNQATGNAKVTAMAQVINELVAQRRAMQRHMQQMMQSHRMMDRPMKMQMQGDQAPAQPGAPQNRAAPGADSSGHSEHHRETNATQ